MKPPRPLYLGIVFLIALLAFAIVSGVAAPGPVAVRDAQGVEFVKVRDESPHEIGEVFDAELWQRVGAVGPAHPFYFRLLTPAGAPPMFTRSQ